MQEPNWPLNGMKKEWLQRKKRATTILTMNCRRLTRTWCTDFAQIHRLTYFTIGKMSTITHKYDAAKYRTPTGTKLNCKGWIQEAALRMLLNNLDPEVAERPDDLIVYGGRGKAARNFESLDLIIKALKDLEDDETLLDTKRQTGWHAENA
jgi:hypothetical protein